jgi:hypothetical protein
MNNMRLRINTVEDCKMYNIVEAIVGSSFGMDCRMAVRVGIVVLPKTSLC